MATIMTTTVEETSIQDSCILDENKTDMCQENLVNNVFQIDRHRIQSVEQGPEELTSLGITIYDQDTFEKGILEQVDEALERQNRDQVSTIEESSNDNISIIEIPEESSGKSEKQDPKEDTLKRGKQNVTDSNKSLLFQALKHGGKETDHQRKIRMGEMTPFGSVVDRKDISQNDCLTHLNEYFQSQISLQKSHKLNGLKETTPEKERKKIHSSKVYSTVLNKNDSKSPSKSKSPLKKNILVPSKRRKKEMLGCKISDPEEVVGSPGNLLSEVTPLDVSDDCEEDWHDHDDSDYVPEEEVEIKRKSSKPNSNKVRIKRRKTKIYAPPEEWGTDDSDWESSSDETPRRSRKSSKKEVDDGNKKDYDHRIKCWELSKTMDNSGDHTLNGGFKLPKSYWSKLYKFQKVGVQWMWELHQQGCGGILGDEMGLGKTIQVISFLAGLSHSRLVSRHKSYRGLGPTLIVCPTTVLHQWVREFHTWWPPFRVAILHESGSYSGKRESLIEQISSKGGILIVSFVGVVQHCSELTNKNWHYVILDEGHKIRNPDAQVTLAVKQFRTPHRLILSGSPMQNNLKELWSLFDFVFPGKLGTLPVFIAQFAVPITQGGYTNASEVQVATAFRCATVLRDTISPYLLRRVKSDVKSHIHLPEKNEQVLFCKLTDEQRELYKAYLDSGEISRILDGHTKIFVGLINLRKICNHPDLYSAGPKLFRGQNEEDIPEEQRYGYWTKSGKMIVVESLLKIWKKQGHKVLLFTQSRQMLCVLEAFVQKQGYTYLKLDGGTSVGSRQPLINKFNQDPSYFVFLLTTRVGGLGVNLTGANRVVIFDPDWNPATDTQARERAWRIGQQNQVTVYRLVTAGTIEEKIYHRQIFKQFLTNKVLSDPKQRRFFKSNDLFELFTLKEGNEEGSTETSAIFAGTGSEVRLKKLREKLKKKRKECQEKMKEDVAKIHNPSQDSVTFSKTKLEHMKKLAQRLSKVIGLKEKNNRKISIDNTCGSDISKSLSSSKSETVTSGELEITNIVQDVVKKLVSDVVSNLENTCDQSIVGRSNEQKIHEHLNDDISSECKLPNETSEQISYVSQSKTNSVNNYEDDHNIHHSHKRKHKHKKSKRRKEVTFEGNEVPHLVAMESKRSNEADDKEVHSEQDDYVLQKLFKKSGLQTVLKHDKIMEGGPADHALVEGEARRVAKEALQALRRSRQQCFAAETGRPSWTGQSGILRTPGRSKFAPKKSKPGSQVYSKDSSEEQRPMSSSDLLTRIRQRRALTDSMTENNEEEDITDPSENPEPPVPPVILTSPLDPDTNVELLRDIRNFVAFGAVVDGRASTKEIVDKFKERLPPSSTPVFKFLLEEVCNFFRLPSGEGMWKLRPEFQW